MTCTDKLCEVSNRLVFLIFKSRHQSRQTKRNLASAGITNFKIAHHRTDHEYFECLHILTFSVFEQNFNLRTAVPLNYGLSSINNKNY